MCTRMRKGEKRGNRREGDVNQRDVDDSTSKADLTNRGNVVKPHPGKEGRTAGVYKEVTTYGGRQKK